MKNLFALSMIAALTACSFHNENPHHSQALENAKQACQKVAKEKDAFQSCLAQRGF